MFTHIDVPIETVFVLAAAGLLLQLCQQLQRQQSDARPNSTPDYLFKMSRLTGHSEYEIFHKSAETWPVSSTTVDRHFKDYLLNQSAPHYVNAFVRKHQQQVDHLKMPPW